MKEIEIREFEEKKDEYQILTIQQIKEQLNELNIFGIKIDGNCLIRFSDSVLSILYNDKEHPIVLKNSSFDNRLYINPEWYLENQELGNELIRYICENIDREEFSIGTKALIDDELIDSICRNKKLKNVSLAEYDDDGYYLTQEHYLKFKDSNIERVETKGVEKELEENFDFLIGCNFGKKLISFYSYNDIIISKKIYISKLLDEYEINNLKYLGEDSVLEFDENSYFNVNEVSEKLKELNKSNKIVIKVNNKEKFNKWLFENTIIGKNIFIYSDGMEVSLQDYLRFEKQLYEMVEEARGLSLFERYIYAYNVTKRFKEYQENEEDKHSARKLYSILENKFMVCVGFSELFGDLLNKLGIENYYLSVAVDTSYDEVDLEKEEVDGILKSTNNEGHARRYVHIADEKYGIDGFYVSDPTWDNDLEQDFYNHLALTSNEVISSKRYFWIDKYDSSELFNVNSISEFIKKINFLLNREHIFDNKLKNIINDLVGKIRLLDFKYVEQLEIKYPFILENNWPNDITDFIYDLGDYVVRHVNNDISGEVIMNAVSNVYKKAYGYSEEACEIKMKEIASENKKRQEKMFPIRYRIDNDGGKEIVMNYNNKFDLDNLFSKSNGR